MRTGWTASLNEGQTFTNGWLILENESDAPVTLVKVEPVFSGEGLRLVGTRVSGTRRTIGTIQYEPRFPPADTRLATLYDVDGYVVKPRQTSTEQSAAAILIGLKIVKAGRSTIQAMDVTYRQNGRLEVQRITNTLAVCAPKSDRPCADEPGLTE
jgi:hypothetical protein